MKKEPFIITVIQDLTRISTIVNSHFRDEKKTAIWLNTSNHLLGYKMPIEMIFEGRTNKLIEFIKSSLEENVI